MFLPILFQLCHSNIYIECTYDYCEEQDGSDIVWNKLKNQFKNQTKELVEKILGLGPYCKCDGNTKQ